MKFPSVSGSNLLRQQLHLPADFEGEWNLVFVPFWQWQQMEVDTWSGTAAELEQCYPALRYYELPTIRAMNPIAQWFINEGMRGGIPNPKTRQRTITLYLDKNSFQRALEMTDADHIYILLVNRLGEVAWSGRGACRPEMVESLEAAIQAQIPVKTA